MVSLSLFPRLLAAQELDVASMVGEDWYGLYLNGQKAGYSRNAVEIEEDGAVVVVDDARFKTNMVGVRQDMEIYSKRTYEPAGDLRSIEYRVVDPASVKEFVAVVDGNELVLTSTIGGNAAEQRVPKPKESLKDTLKQAQLVGKDAKVGDAITFTLFEPMYQKEIEGASRIVAIEDRMLDGVRTKVFRIDSKLPEVGIESEAYVTEDGTVLEDVTAGIITTRLEPEALAKDVNYCNDVIVSNAAMVDAPIENPRQRETLRLRLDGPLTPDHLFNDERQSIVAVDDHFEFTGRRVSLAGFQPVSLPITQPDVMEWINPTLFVQSDDPKLIEKSKEIVGDATGSFEVTERLCHWVHQSVRTTFSAQLTNAREVLDRLEGDCTEYSILFVGLARAAGLPAREVAGVIYMEGTQPGFYFHQWAKVWIGKWIDVDPTFDQPLVDVTHIKLVEGDFFQQNRLIPVIGRIKIEVLDDQGNP